MLSSSKGQPKSIQARYLLSRLLLLLLAHLLQTDGPLHPGCLQSQGMCWTWQSWQALLICSFPVSPTWAAAAAAAAAANTITGTASRLAAAAAAGFVPLDARDAGTVALIGEAAAALKLLHEKCGSDLLQHLCGLVLPASGLPGEVQQQLVYHIQESDAKQLKDFLRGLLLSVAGSVAK